MRSTLTRRAFLQASAASTAGSTLPRAGQAVAAPAAELQGASAPAVGIELVVNGEPRRLVVEPRTTLVESLRGPLGLTGTKVSCDRGACSACTVWLDGDPVCACMTLVVEIAGRSVTTIEGLSRGDALHPVQSAFVEHDALQCGFCTSGMVMSCAALLARQPDPGPADAKAAIAGHLCRCGSYPHVVDATLAAARARKA